MQENMLSAAIARIDISEDEIQIVHAALNEICNGIELFEFETRIGAPRDRVATLQREFRALLQKMKPAS
jgi:Asp-tRNA(Asn)/Glu-tRNA(Gln) amidotransferase C subunit